MNHYKIITPADQPPPNAEWRIVTENQNYEISEYGHIRRVTTGSGAVVGKILKSSMQGGRYFKHDLQMNGRNIKRKAHRLVALAFIDNPNLFPCVLHIDGNSVNCHYSNLKWGTQLDNYDDAIRHGTLSNNVGENNPFAKFKEKDVIFIKTSKSSIMELSRKYNTTINYIKSILHGHRWGHVIPQKRTVCRVML